VEDDRVGGVDDGKAITGKRAIAADDRDLALVDRAGAADADRVVRTRGCRRRGEQREDGGEEG
jgi:hypothetical protein